MVQLKDNKSKKVLIGMSGGVDSSVAAYLLKKQGFCVTAVTMSVWDGSFDMPVIEKSGCYGPGEKEDIAQAKAIAKKIGIPHLVVDLSKEYKENVLNYFCREYSEGKTPNPCVMCNQRVKFGFLAEKSKSLGIEFDYFATGHYARISYDEAKKRHLLMKGLDKNKDQSYFLSYLKQEQLASILFPLGDKTKDEIRKIAIDIGLVEAASKKESQDFIESDSRSVLFKGKDIVPGDIVDDKGKRLGSHRGIIFYTVGQRKGLNIDAKGSSSKPLYVTRIDAKNNLIVVGEEEGLMSEQCTASNLNWIAIEGLDKEMELTAKIRQQHKGAKAILSPIGSRVLVKFREPQRAISPGQTIVFYDEDIVIAAGMIEKP